MYKIFAGDTCIYRDAYTVEETSLSEPKLTLADNSAGQLSFAMAPTNAGFHAIQHLTTRITVYKDNKWLWEGRAISEDENFWHDRIITCEGALAFLNDTHQPPAEYHNQTPAQFLISLINVHNSKVSADKRFTVGKVTVTDPNNSIYRYTNYETTFDCLNDKLIKQLGGHFVVRREGSTLYLDYLADYNSVNEQPIEFGNNLLDFTRSYDLTDFCTVVVPKGKQLESSPISALEAYTTVAPVNGGSIYVQNEEAVKAYGWIEKVIECNDVEEPANLLRKAKEYLSSVQFDDMTLELKAVDLHYLNPNITDISLLDQVKVISKIHGLNRTFPATKLEIPMDNPDQATFSLGTVKKVKEQSYTQSTKKAISDVQTQVSDNYTEISTGMTEMKEDTAAEFEKTNVKLEKTNDSIVAEVTRAQGAEGNLSARITINADAISSEVSRASQAEGNLSSRITQTANEISSEVARASQAEGNLSSRISQTASEISAKVDANGVITAINMSAEGVKIQASKVDISGNLTAKALQTGQMSIEGSSITNSEIVNVSGSAWEFNNNVWAADFLCLTGEWAGGYSSLSQWAKHVESKLK